MIDETASAPSAGGAPGGSAWRLLAMVLALWIAGLAASTALARVATVSGLLFVLLGVSAGCLARFPAGELRRASSASPFFWETAARDAWIAGATGAVLFFIRALGDSAAGLAAMARGMALSFVVAVYGLLVGALCFVRLLRLNGATQPAPAVATARGSGRALGLALYAVLLAWTIAHPYLGGAAPRFAPWDFVFDWPSILVVLGAALMLMWTAGGALRGRVEVLSLALSGTLGALAGLVVALVGFADRSLERVTSGLGFMVTACFVTLVGLALFANAAEDRRAMRGEPGVPTPWSRMAWLLFPLITILVLVVTLILVMTPMTRKL